MFRKILSLQKANKLYKENLYAKINLKKKKQSQSKRSLRAKFAIIDATKDHLALYIFFYVYIFGLDILWIWL